MRESMDGFLRRWLFYFLLALVMAGLGWLGVGAPVQRGVEVVLNPLSGGVRSMVNVVLRPWEMVRFAYTGPDRILDLESRLAEALVEQAELETLRQENNTLRSLLESGVAEEWSVVPGTVVGGGERLVIGVGSGSGLQEGDMVLSPEQALVGRVAVVTGASAWVETVGHEGTRVTATLLRGDADGIVVGEGGVVLMTEIEQLASVREGDVVLTSGVDGLYPAGVVIGRVVGVRDDESKVYQEATVELATDLRALQGVGVVVDYGGGE